MKIAYLVIWHNNDTGEETHGNNYWQDGELANKLARALTTSRHACSAMAVWIPDNQPYAVSMQPGTP
jgi:hypothetical protein